MNVKRLVAGWALALTAGASMASPTCYSTTSWNSLGGAWDYELFSQTFTSAGDRTDCYTFTLDNASHAFGGVIEKNYLFNELDIELTSVSLFLGDTIIGAPDQSPLWFSFGGLASGGLYTLAVASKVTLDPGLFDMPVGYRGLIATVAAPVPEPGLVALAIAGLLGVGVMARRRRSR